MDVFEVVAIAGYFLQFFDHPLILVYLQVVFHELVGTPKFSFTKSRPNTIININSKGFFMADMSQGGRGLQLFLGAMQPGRHISYHSLTFYF